MYQSDETTRACECAAQRSQYRLRMPDRIDRQECFLASSFCFPPWQGIGRCLSIYPPPWLADAAAALFIPALHRIVQVV